MLALLSAVENVLPPVPSDAAVALGALLSHRGVTTPLVVFLVTWIANLLGAAGVYYASRRYGRRLFATPTGRRLLAPRSLAIIEREYLRLGTLGIFISRFLPGIRAVVPPFAGLIGLSTARTFVPMGLASAIWYGGITTLGAVIGAEWDRITALIASVNRTLGLVTAVVAAAGAVWWLLRVRRRRRERVWHATQDALDPAAPTFMAGTELAEGSAREAAALVVLELAYADPALTPEERRLIAEHLHTRWGLSKPSTPPAPPPEAERRTRFAGYARRLRKRVGQKERLELVERMWTVAFADGAIGEHETRLMRLAAELLDIAPGELADVSRRLQAQRDL